jgi:hypothetical protein
MAAPTPEDREEAKKLVTQAQKDANGGKHAAAIRALRKAVDLDPSPPNKLELAKELVKMNKLAQARQMLTTVLEGDKKVPGARQAAKAAEKLVNDIDARIPRLTLKIEGPEPGTAIVSIDGEIVDSSNAVLVDPGQHKLLVEAEGFDAHEQTVKLQEMSQETVSVTMRADGTTPKESEADGSATKKKKKKKGPISPIIPASIAFGVGAVGLGVGTAFGVMAMSEANKAKGFCTGNICPDNPQIKSARDLSILNGNVSTAMFVVGGVGVATGVILLLVLPSSKAKKKEKPPVEPVEPAESTETTEPAESTEEASVRPWFGANQIGIMGTF